MLGPLRKALVFLPCIALAFALAGNAALLVGCKQDTREEVGEAAESIGEDIEEGAEDAAEEAGEALEDIGEEMQ